MNDTSISSEGGRSYDEVNDYRIGKPFDKRKPRDLVNVFEFAEVKVRSKSPGLDSNSESGLDSNSEYYVEFEYTVYSEMDEARVSSVFKSVPLKKEKEKIESESVSQPATQPASQPARNNAYETMPPKKRLNSGFDHKFTASISHFMDSSYLPRDEEKVSLKCSLMQKKRRSKPSGIATAVPDVKSFFLNLFGKKKPVTEESESSFFISSTSIPSTRGLDFVRNEPFSPLRFFPLNRKDMELELEITKERWCSLYADFDPDYTIGLMNVSEDEERRLPAYYRRLVKSFPDFVKDLGIQKASSLPLPVDAPNPFLEEKKNGDQNKDDCVVELDGVLIFPKRDEHVEEGCLERILPFLNVLPISKVDTQFNGDRKSAMYYIREVVENMLKKQNTKCGLVHWKDDLCDPVMKRVFFTSLGQHVVKRLKEGEEGYPGYIADLMDLKKYKYREGYEPLACKVLFDTDGDITEIKDTDGTTYKPSTNRFVSGYHTVDTSTTSYQRMWEWMKQKARSATFAWVSLQHLSIQHYLWGNYGSTSLRLYLPTNHKFRITFCCHFWRTAFTCKLARPLLYEERGLLSRLINLDYKEGLEQIMKDYINEFEFGTYPEDLERRGLISSEDELPDCKFHIGVQDGLPLYKIIKKYVSGMVDEIFPTESSLQRDDDMRKTYKYWTIKFKGTPREYKLTNVKKVWGEIIFQVSALHSSIGNVKAWALDPSFINMRLKRPPADDADNVQDFRWDLVAPMESAIGVALISTFATMDSPNLYQDWSHILKKGFGGLVPEAYNTFRKELEDLEEQITLRNYERQFPADDFLPSKCELSIAS